MHLSDYDSDSDSDSDCKAIIPSGNEKNLHL